MSGITRRGLIAAVGAVAAMPSLAQEKTQRVGVLLLTGVDALPNIFVQEMRRLGWAESDHFHIDVRRTDPGADRIQAASSALVKVAPDVILTQTSPLLSALMRDTKSIPIVFLDVSDPVGRGFVASVAHPGGNVTGLTNFEFSMGSKWLALLKEVAPATTRAAIVIHPEMTPAGWIPAITAAGPALGVAVTVAAVRDDAEFDAAAAGMAREPGGGLIVTPSGFTITPAHGSRIIDAATRYRLPAVYPAAEIAERGGLVSYSNDPPEKLVQAAGYVDRILRGARPADLPVQFPTKFKLVVNLKTAKAIGLAIPESFLVRADEVIE